MAIKQEKSLGSVAQVNYLGRWVSKEHFRTFVYSSNQEEKLANSYAEYEKLIASGEWHAEKVTACEKAEILEENLQEIEKISKKSKTSKNAE